MARRLTAHQRRTRRLRNRSDWHELKRRGVVVATPPSPLYDPIMLAGLQAGLTRREIRFQQQDALMRRVGARALARFVGRNVQTT